MRVLVFSSSQDEDEKRREPSHPCVARFVDDDRFPRLVHVVVHAKVGCHAVKQHAMVGGHLREFLVLVTGGEAKHKKWYYKVCILKKQSKKTGK